MSVRDGLLISKDFGASSATSWVVDIPSGYTMGTVVAQNVGASSSGFIKMSLGDGEGSPIVQTGRSFIADGTGPVQDSADAVVAITLVGTSNLRGTGHFWNLNTAAPLIFMQQSFMSPYQDRCTLWKSITPRDQIIFTQSAAGTINAGTIYVQLYERPNVVISRNFSSSPGRTWNIGGLLNSNATALVLASWDLTMDTTSEVFAKVSTDGVVFDGDANQYRRGMVRFGADTAELNPYATITQTGGTAVGMCSVYTGLPLLTRTMWQTYDIQVLAAACRLSLGNRESRKIEQALQVFGSNDDMVGGTGYAIKYAM